MVSNAEWLRLNGKKRVRAVCAVLVAVELDIEGLDDIEAFGGTSLLFPRLTNSKYSHFAHILKK